MKFNEKLTNEKPREKLEKYGVETLTDSELLEILLRTGNKTESVDELSTRIIKEIGGITKLNERSLTTLTKIKGIKLSKASTILASIELGKRIINKKEDKVKLNNTLKIFNYFKNDFKGLKQEKFFVLLFDTKMNLIKKKEIYKGTVDNVLAHPREIYKEAILESATFIIVMHNHPSGDPTPSKEDIETTKRLKNTGDIIGIKCIDHIIITSTSYYSFYEEALKLNDKHKINNRWVLVSKKEEFKSFAKENKHLIKLVNDGSTTWQKLYETYDIYGSDDKVWEQYKTTKKETTKTTDGVKNILNNIKNIDMDKLEENITGIQKALDFLEEIALTRHEKKRRKDIS